MTRNEYYDEQAREAHERMRAAIDAAIPETVEGHVVMRMLAREAALDYGSERGRIACEQTLEIMR